MSAHADLLDWAKLSIQALGLVTTNSVVTRKRPVFVKGDPDPLILICPGGETLDGRVTSGYYFLMLPVLVCIVSQVSQRYGDPTWLANARASIRSVMLQPKPIDGASVAGYDSNPFVSLDGFPEGYDVSPQQFTYRASEALSGA